MNPEENNPLASSTGMSGMGNFNNTASMPGVGGLSMADSLASAQDNLTSAGLAAPSAQGVMGLDQLGASNPEAVMAPPMEEPLVPAAPVPGSIGSVTSVPPSAGTANPFAPAEPANAQSTQGGPVPVPEVAPQAPFNPFAPEAATQNPAASAAGATATPTSQQPSSGMTPIANPAKPGVNPAFQPAAPTKAKKASGGKKPMNMTVILLSALSAILAIALIIFIVLFIQASNNPKIVYVPTTSNEDSSHPIEILSCSREANFGFLVGTENVVNGSESFTASYSKNQIQALSLTYDIIFGEGYDLELAKDNLVADTAALVGSLSEDFTAEYEIKDGDELIAVIKSSNDIIPAEEDVEVFVHRDGENLGKNSMSDVKSIYEALGYVCAID